MSDRLRLPPGPLALPVVGALPWMVRDPLAFYQSMSLDYGPISYAPIARAKVYMVGDPVLLEQLLTEKPKQLMKDAITRTLQPLVGQGLLISEGEAWKRQRKLCAHAFLPKRLNSYEDVMVDCAHELFGRFRDGEARDFHRDSMRVTLEVVGRTLLGIHDSAELDHVGRFADDALAYFEERTHAWGALLPREFPTPRYLRFKSAKAQLDSLIREQIARVRSTDPRGDYLLARLVRARDEDGQGMSEQELIDEGVTMLLAGHETTALTLMYAVRLLAAHPAQRELLRREVDDVLGTRRARAADLEHMPYLAAVIREALRLYPPAYAFGREVVEAFELGGYELPVGAQVLGSPFAMHRNPRLWSDPLAFKPARWLEGEVEHLPRYAFIPFGGGHRICIGSHFALLEAGLLLATLMQYATLEVRADFKIQLSPVVTLRSKNGLPVTVHRRPMRSSTREAPSVESHGCPHMAAKN